MSNVKKKPKKKSPTARAMEEIRKMGFFCWVVESTIPHTFIKRDFMGWCDLIYLTKTNIVGVQVTSGTSKTGGGNHAARKSKILAEPRALAWIEAGGICEVWSYSQPKGSKFWECRKEEVVASDFFQERTNEAGG